MAKILISYYKIQEVPLDKVNCMWDGLIQDLKQYGNDVFVINTAYFNTYYSNIVKNKKIDSLILSKVKAFKPEIIITFNHRIPQCILDNFQDIPIILWDGDSLQYFCDLEYLKNNISRYIIFSIVKKWEKDYLDFGFEKKQIYYMPIATSIKKKDIPQDKNISFLGAIHYNNGKIIELINSHLYNRAFSNIVKEATNNPTYNYEQLFLKHFDTTYIKLDLNEKDLYPLFDYRILTLANLIDLGLQINGHRWNLVTPLLPYLGALYDTTTIWTLSENEQYLNSSIISLNPIHPQAKGSGFSWRVYDIMASNACLVCEYSSDLITLTQNHVDIPMFKTPWEARELVKELLKDDSARKQIVSASQKFIDFYGRWIHRFSEIERILNISIINQDKKGQIVYLKDDVAFKNLLSQKKKNIELKKKIKNKLIKYINKL